MYEQTTTTNCILWCLSHYYIETPAGNHSYILFTSIEKPYELLASIKQLYGYYVDACDNLYSPHSGALQHFSNVSQGQVSKKK